MSGVAKAVGKVFSGIANVVKKVALPLLGVAAIVMTGGAALGLPALAGGFGGAVTSGLAAMGAPANGVLASVLTQAGTGAAIGGVSSLATGGDFAKGAAMGAAGGALTGGVTGLLGATGSAAAAPAVTMSSRSLPGLGAATAPAVQTGAVIPSTSLAANPGAVVAPAAAAPTGGLGGVMKGLGKFLTSEGGSSIVGQTIAGGAQGLLQGMAVKDKAATKSEEQERITQSYSIAPSAFGPNYAAANTGNPTVEQKYGRRPTSRYRYDRTRREIVRD